MRTAALFIAFLAATTAAGATSTAAPSVRAWTGSYTLHGRSALGVIFEGGSGVVALGTGHADAQRVRLVRRGTALRFVVPYWRRLALVLGLVPDGRRLSSLREPRVAT